MTISRKIPISLKLFGNEIVQLNLEPEPRDEVFFSNKTVTVRLPWWHHG